jgi:hypothetical protein
MIFGKRKRKLNNKLHNMEQNIEYLKEKNKMLEHILFECCFDKTKEGKCKYKIGDVVLHKTNESFFRIERVLFIPHNKEAKYLLRGYYSSNEHGLSDEGDIELISRAYSEGTPKTK